jgi:hypothetical protein
VGEDNATGSRSKDNSIAGATAAGAVSTGIAAKVMTRHYLASEHLWAATVAAHQCRELEASLRGGSRPTNPTHRAEAITAVMSSVAFVESLINEIYADAAEDTLNRLEGLDGQCIRLLKEYWQSAADRTSTLSKAQMALLFVGAAQLDRGAQVWQDMDLLTAWRNALVHFKPAWHDDEQPTRLETRLTGRFPKSQLLRDNDGSPWPIWSIAAGGAEWAVMTARAFADEWTDRMGLRRVYETDLHSFERHIAENR